MMTKDSMFTSRSYCKTTKLDGIQQLDSPQRPYGVKVKDNGARDRLVAMVRPGEPAGRSILGPGSGRLCVLGSK